MYITRLSPSIIWKKFQKKRRPVRTRGMQINVQPTKAEHPCPRLLFAFRQEKGLNPMAVALNPTRLVTSMFVGPRAAPDKASVMRPPQV